MEGHSKIEKKHSEILMQYKIPILEMSGVAFRFFKGKSELLVVNDSEDKIFQLNDKFKIKSVIELSKFNEYKAIKGAQWEAISIDENGNIYILKESPPLIVKIDQSLSRVIEIIHLKNSKRFHWGENKNDNAEGLIVINNNSFLVIKEKKPMKIINWERIEPNGQLIPKSIWSVDKKIKDISDIAINNKKEIYLLSDKSRSIYRVNLKNKSKNGQIEILKRYKLPKSLKKPEGITFNSNNQPIIVLDSKEKNDNLIILKELDK